MKIARKLMKIFGINADNNQRGVFGSLAAGSPAYTTDPEVIQSLANFEQGWYSAVMGNNSPAIQDMNALQFLFSYQLAYLLQQGIPEWNADTEYYIGSFCQVGGVVYKSIKDNNIGNSVSLSTYWREYQNDDNANIIRNQTFRGITFEYGEFSSTLTRCDYSPELDLYAAVSVSGTGDRAAVSRNGVEWFFHNTPADIEWRNLKWCSGMSKFVALAVTGSGGNRCMVYSGEPGSWDGVDMGVGGDQAWRDMAYSPELNTLICISDETVNNAMSTEDGTTWVLRDGPFGAIPNNASAIVWAKSLNTFLVVQNTPDSNVSFYEHDPVVPTWNSVASTNNGFLFLCWSEELGIFCGVGTTHMQVSEDGINWTVAPDPYGYTIRRIIWCKSLMCFITTDSSGVGLSYSKDGLNWVRFNDYDTNINAYIGDLVWSEEQSRLVGVGTNGSFYSL